MNAHNIFILLTLFILAFSSGAGAYSLQDISDQNSDALDNILNKAKNCPVFDARPIDKKYGSNRQQAGLCYAYATSSCLNILMDNTLNAEYTVVPEDLAWYESKKQIFPNVNQIAAPVRNESYRKLIKMSAKTPLKEGLIQDLKDIYGLNIENFDELQLNILLSYAFANRALYGELLQDSLLFPDEWRFQQKQYKPLKEFVQQSYIKYEDRIYFTITYDKPLKTIFPQMFDKGKKDDNTKQLMRFFNFSLSELYGVLEMLPRVYGGQLESIYNIITQGAPICLMKQEIYDDLYQLLNNPFLITNDKFVFTNEHSQKQLLEIRGRINAAGIDYKDLYGFEYRDFLLRFVGAQLHKTCQRSPFTKKTNLTQEKLHFIKGPGKLELAAQSGRPAVIAYGDPARKHVITLIAVEQSKEGKCTAILKDSNIHNITNANELNFTKADGYYISADFQELNRACHNFIY